MLRIYNLQASKRWLTATLVAALLTTVGAGTSAQLAHAELYPTVTLNGVALILPPDMRPVIRTDRTLISARALMEAFGVQVTWDAPTSTVTGRLGTTEIRLTIGSASGTVNGQTFTLDEGAQIINDRTFVPLRFVSEALGAQVGWEGATANVLVHSPLLTVPAPTAAELPEAVRSGMGQISPLEAAYNSASYLYRNQAGTGPFLAPALAAKLRLPLAGPSTAVWAAYRGSTQGPSDTFLFDMKVTTQAPDGSLHESGYDTVQVSRIEAGPAGAEGDGYIATGFGHIAPPHVHVPGAPSVWVHPNTSAPTRSTEPNAIVYQGATGRYGISPAVMKPLGGVQAVTPTTYRLLFGPNQQPIDIAAVTINGASYLDMNSLIQQLNGKQDADSQMNIRADVRWNDAIKQLVIAVSTNFRSS